MAQIQIKLVKSVIDRPERQKRTVQALGLGKMGSTKSVENTPQVAGMINAVKHLLEVTEL
ncbi:MULTISPECIES: 50S ribosomal protein L30 [Hymenobacter]|jgi:large subunit ribosomal protein L30|uniref:Large ribosomal subunit protein uL30 n=5 Tax=Hymenobacter TaxID=89966 RepID=W8F2L9_9BACT|nr:MULTISPECIES: 50S ribosomal protein L30 [Hymenobacter]AHJ99183.1 50S ribosomal protein L30 [Hymenobacter swuensis DY53]MDU0369367.1 50S ribosomal protein L30 [Hymenobacter endophyticus]RSK35208.1 50S ribosomal protein L30 [Hymenobacter metallilatus]RSK46039.1 50S ribosomal protein L30 [Hymenobacter perfusus]RSK51205.1 50S ribosomal protein L30 [Hymenobacter rigui]